MVLVVSAFTLRAGDLNLETADDLYSRLAYNKAAVFYTKYLKKNSDIDVWMKLATCYDKTNNYESLATTLDSVVNHPDVQQHDIAYVEYADVLQILGKKEEAAKWYQKYLDRHPEDTRAKLQLMASQSEMKDESDRYFLENMEFNTPSFEYAPNFLNGAFVYTSTNSEGNTSVKEHNWTGGSYSDLKQYDWDTFNVFFIFNEMDHLNTKYDDGPFVVDPVDGRIYYTRNNYDPTKKLNKKDFGFDDNMNLKIYVADHRLGDIDNVREFEHNFGEYNTGHPAISPDGAYLVFTCDIPDSNAVGGRDLYYCSRDSNGWSAPTLLTPAINTEGDELFPYFHKDGSLYFASDGLGSYGGLDIFKADIDFSNNELTSLEHLSYPINTSYDDFGIVFSNETDGFFTSDRPTGKGHDDIYSFKDNTILLRGIVLNKETDEILPGSFISVGDQEVKILEGETNEEARFETRVHKNKVYDLFADEDYFHSTTMQVNTGKYKGNLPIEVTLRLQPIEYNVLVLDIATNQPISGAVVDVNFNCEQEAINVITRSRGTHELPVYKDCEYSFKAKADGYLAEYLVWQSPKEDQDETVIIYLKEIEIGQTIVLKNIYYDFDESYLRLEESFEDLEKVYNFLRDNPELIVKINSHTDARGSKLYNEGLSQRRAQSVVDHLVGRNISRDRLKAEGFGERQLINHCSDGVKCSEEDHQLNRRTEFQVVDINGATKIESDARKDIKVDPCKGCPF